MSWMLKVTDNSGVLGLFQFKFFYSVFKRLTIFLVHMIYWSFIKYFKGDMQQFFYHID